MEAYPDEVWFQLLIHLSRYIDARVSQSGRHSAQVANWVRSTARRLGCSDGDVKAVFWAALLHDIGKLGVPEEVLSKAGPLTEAEWSVMRLHPTVGANIVRALKVFDSIAPTIRAHQEKYDGTGYPAGLRGDEIPVGARILAVADAYEAMTGERSYRRARSHSEAAQELRVNGGRHFDPHIVEVFLEVVESEASEARLSEMRALAQPHGPGNKKSPVPPGTKDHSAVPPCLPGD